MRAFLVSACAAATAQSENSFDYSKYQKQYSASSGQNRTENAAADGDWKKYAGAHANYSGAYSDMKTSGDWQKFLSASTSGSSSYSHYMDSGKASPDNTYSGPFPSDESILKLKGNVTALKAKKKDVEHSMELVKQYVPENDRTAPLGQLKKDLSDIRHMLKDAETTTEDQNETKGETKDEKKNETSDEMLTEGTDFLARTELHFRPLEKEVDDLKDKIKHVKNRKEDIDRYVPKEYQTNALKDWKKKVDSLDAELKTAEDEMKELTKEKEEDQNKTKGDTKDEKKSETSDEMLTTLLARTDLFHPLEKDVDDLKHKIRHVQERKHDIYKYVPKEYQTNALKHWKRKVERLEAELKEAEDEMQELKKDKLNESTSSNATSSKGHASLSDMMAALVSERPTGPDSDSHWGSMSVSFCAIVSVLSLAVALRRRSVNVDQRPLLG